MRTAEACLAPRRHVLSELTDLLNRQYGDLSAKELLRLVIDDLAPGRAAIVSSFGAESAVLLHLVSEVDAGTPVIFLDTGKHFQETLAYREALTADLGLTDVRSVGPDEVQIGNADRDGKLWQRDPDLCCGLRKREPLVAALKPFFVWVSGRKRQQSGSRSNLELFEADPPHIKLNPLAHWSRDDVEAYAKRHALPEHPLVGEGYPSIGCAPCTDRVRAGEDPRAGRWRGLGKTECGIHGAARGVTIIGGAG